MNCSIPEINKQTLEIIDNLGETFTLNYFRKNNLSSLPSFKELIENNSIAFTEARLLEMVEKFLPRNKFQVKHLDEIIQSLPSNTQAAFFKDVLYFGNNVTKEQIAEETFHAIFQRVIPTNLKEQYLSEGRSLIENLNKEKENYLKSYPKAELLSNKELEERVIEEAIAKKYVEYFNKNIAPSNKKGILKLLENLFKWLKELYNKLKGDVNLEVLFDGIIKGKFTKSIIQDTNESEVPTLRLVEYETVDESGNKLKRNLSIKESEFLISSLGSFVLELNQLDREKLVRLGLTNRAKRIQFAIEKLKEHYSDNPKFTSALTEHFKLDVNPEATSRKDRLIKTILPNIKNLKEDVNKYLNVVTGVELKNEEINEDEVAELDFSDNISANEKGFEGMSSWLRGYIATTGKVEGSVEVEGELVNILAPIDKNKVYYSLARGMQNTTHELERLYKLVTIASFKTNKDTRELLDRIIKDVVTTTNDDGEIIDGDDTESIDERFRLFKKNITALYNTWKSDKVGHHYKINEIKGLRKDKTFILQTLLQGFDLWKRDNYKVFLETKKGKTTTKVFEANQNSASKVQMDMWQNKWEENFANKEIKKNIANKLIDLNNLVTKEGFNKENVYEILNTIFYDVDESYVNYLFGEDNIGNLFSSTADLEDVKKIFEIARFDIINNDKSKLFEGDEGVKGRIEKLAINTSKINENVIESTYKDAENKTRYSYQSKTFQLYMFNELFSGDNFNEYLANIQKGEIYEYAEGKWLKQTSSFLYQENDSLGLNHISFKDKKWNDVFKKGNYYSVDGLDTGTGSVTFGSMTNRDFLVWKLHLKEFKTKGVNKDDKGQFEYLTQPIHINIMEAKRTSSFKEVMLIEDLYTKDGVTERAIELFRNEILREVRRMYDEKSKIINWLKILSKDREDGKLKIDLTRENVLNSSDLENAEGIIEKYHTGTYSIIKNGEDITILETKARALQFTDNVKSMLTPNTFSNVIKDVFTSEKIEDNKTLKVVNAEIKSQLNEYIKEFTQLVNSLKGILPNNVSGRYGDLNSAPNEFQKANFINDELSSWLNTIWVNQLINSDSALLVKNDGADFVKRAGGQNAAIASLSTTFYSPKLKGITKFDKINYVVGNDPQGIIGFKSKDKKGRDNTVDSADAQSYMTVDAYLKYLHSTSKLSDESAEILLKIKKGISLTEEDKEYMKENDVFFNVIKPVGYDGYFYFKTGTVMLTKALTSDYVDGKWIAKPGREALHNLREKMEATGVDYYLGQTASKQLTINKYTEEFDNIKHTENEVDDVWGSSINQMSTKFFGQQMENPAGKEKIIDPSQMLEIILNEQNPNINVFLNGEKLAIGDLLKKWQQLSINRLDLSFNQAMNEIADEGLVLQYNKFLNRIKETLATSGADDQLLEIFSLDDNGNPAYNLNMSLSIDKFINLLMSHFSKGVLQQKVAGDAMALVSPHGVNGIKKIVKYKTEDGKDIYSWEYVKTSDPRYNEIIKLHQTSPFKNLSNIGEYDEFDNKSQLKGGSNELINELKKLYEEGKGEDVYFIDQLRFGKPTYSFNKEGKVIGVELYSAEALLPKHKKGINIDVLKRIFGLRIPSQDKQSGVNIEWVDEIPEYYGNTIIAPKEIQYLSGSDYDIDKLYIHRKETFEKDGKEIVWGKEHNTFEMYKYYHTTKNVAVKQRINQLINKDEYLPKLRIKLSNIKKELEKFKEDPELYTLTFYTKEVLENLENYQTQEEFELYNNQLEEIQNSFDNLDENIKSAKILELKALIKASKESVQEGINYVKDVITGVAFKEYKLITSEKEFNETKGIKILPIINNEMLDMKMRFLMNDHTLDRSGGEAISLTPATQDNLKEFIAETYIVKDGKPYYLFKKDGKDEFTTDVKYSTHSTLGQNIAHKNVVTGKRNIGVAVVANLLHLFSKKANIQLRDSIKIIDVIPVDDKGLHELSEYNLSTFTIDRNIKNQRIADIISELISAATDEAKDQQNAKYNLTIEALNIVTPILMLGGSLDFAIRLINSEKVKAYLTKVGLKDNIAKTKEEKDELQTSNELLLKSMINDTNVNGNPVSILDLKEGKNNDNALALAAKMLTISKEIGLAKYVINLKKGLGKTLDEFEQGEEKIASTTKEKLAPVHLTTMPKVFNQDNEDLLIYKEQIDKHNILSELFNNNILSRKNSFQYFKYFYSNNFKTPTYEEARKWLNDNMISFIYSRLYFNFLKQSQDFSENDFKNFTFAKLEDVEKEWTTFVKDVKDGKANLPEELMEEIKQNPLLNKLKTNKEGRIFAPTFAKSDIATNSSLLESFWDLHTKLSSSDYKMLMWKLFHYSIHKDGWTFKGGSLSKVIPPIMYKRHSNSLDEFINDESVFTGEFTNGFLVYSAIERSIRTKGGTEYIKRASSKQSNLWNTILKKDGTLNLNDFYDLTDNELTWLSDNGYIITTPDKQIILQFPLYHKFRSEDKDKIFRMEKLNVSFDDGTTSDVTPDQYFYYLNRVEMVNEIKYAPFSYVAKPEDEYLVSLPIKGEKVLIKEIEVEEKVKEKNDENKKNNIKNINPKDFTNHSGGANGVDIDGDIIGREFGVTNHIHYYTGTKSSLNSPYGNQEVKASDITEGAKKVAQAANKMWGNNINGKIVPYSYSTMKDPRLIRNWSQVKYSEGIYAVAPLGLNGDAWREDVKSGKDNPRVLLKDGVQGGTGYAVEMGIQNGNKVYVFNTQENSKYDIGWYQVVNEVYKKLLVPPILTKNFAIIGSRDNSEIGKKAIRDIYEKTFSNSKKIEEQKENVNQNIFTFYHRTNSNDFSFEKYDINKSGTGGGNTFGKGLYVTDTFTDDERYGKYSHSIEFKVSPERIFVAKNGTSDLIKEINRLAREKDSNAKFIGDVSSKEAYELLKEKYDLIDVKEYKDQYVILNLSKNNNSTNVESKKDVEENKQLPFEYSEIQGINIKTDKSQPNSLGNRLTNPNWYSKELMDVEAPYKANASKIKAPHLNKDDALKYDMNLMYGLQVQKFRKNPELIDEINEQGGLEFIKQSSHIVGVKNSRWEGKGMESNFIKVLAKSYETVAKELGKFKELPFDNSNFTDLTNDKIKKEVFKDESKLSINEKRDRVLDVIKKLFKKHHIKYNWSNFQYQIHTPLEIINKVFSGINNFYFNDEELEKAIPAYFGLKGEGLSINISKEKNKDVYIGGLYLPDFMQKKGIGKDIVNIFKQVSFRFYDVNRIYLWSEKDSVSFWEKQGFTKTGEQIEESDKHFSNPDLPPFEVMEYVYNRNKDEDLPSNPPTCINI